MIRPHEIKRYIIASIIIGFVLVFPGQAKAIKYMTLKEAIKYFLPQGATLSQVEKSIPANKLESVKKRFDLKKTADFKEKISSKPYTIYIGRGADGKALVYIFIVDQFWRTCYHKYAIGLTPDGAVKELIVVEFNCKYQYPTNKKSFLKQFKGKRTVKGKKVPVHIHKDIDVVSGATWTCDAAAIVTRRAMALHELFFSEE